MKTKSPREKENKTINVKHKTIAGPKSPRTRKSRIEATIAISANEKNDHRLCHLVYSEINFSFVVKNPARNRMRKNFTISLG